MPPPYKIKKNSVPKTKDNERIKLALKIKTAGVAMVPCSWCSSQHRRCIKDVSDPERTRCSECVRSRKVCDASVPLTDRWETEVPRAEEWESVGRQIDRLDEELDAAMAEVAELQSTAMAKQKVAMAKVVELRRKKNEIKEREKEMMRRGLRYLDELDALEWKEERERVEREAAETVTPEPSVPFFGGAFGDPILSPSFWASQDVGGETPQATPGN